MEHQDWTQTTSMYFIFKLYSVMSNSITFLLETNKRELFMPDSHSKEAAVNGRKNGTVVVNHQHDASWTCKKCTLINPIGENVCSACSCSQLYSEKKVESQVSAHSPTKKDTWSCPQCTLLNSHSISKCRACKTAMTPQSQIKVRRYCNGL